MLKKAPPPPKPRRGADSWQQVFIDLGTPLPVDYVAFINKYGSCQFASFLGIGDPRDSNESTYHQAWCDFGDRYRARKNEFPEFHPLAAWPDPGGFLGWGNDIDGNWYGWATEGEPNHWPTAVWGRQRRDEIIGHIPMTEFLSGWLSSPPKFNDLPDLSNEDDDTPNQITCTPW
ncbi:SMI1/KNR4 family protein [Actinomadura livida]|nr:MULTISPECIES: SMI1/KNR4 family protein [Actinomadura]MBB4772944.1 hypothetical protein [Actinomadura catellatispora]